MSWSVVTSLSVLAVMKQGWLSLLSLVYANKNADKELVHVDRTADERAILALLQLPSFSIFFDIDVPSTSWTSTRFARIVRIPWPINPLVTASWASCHQDFELKFVSALSRWSLYHLLFQLVLQQQDPNFLSYPVFWYDDMPVLSRFSNPGFKFGKFHFPGQWLPSFNVSAR